MELNLVLFEPEIPQNTANIMRTCVATNTILHLIEPLGFSLADKYINRGSANHAKLAKYFVYKNIEEFKEKNIGIYCYLTRYAKKNFYDFKIGKDQEKVYYFLGKESTGIPYELLSSELDKCYRIPMMDNVRSLNLASTAAVVLFEAQRQLGFPKLSPFEPENFKGKNYLIK